MLVWFKADPSFPIVYLKDNRFCCILKDRPFYTSAEANIKAWEDKITNIGPNEISRWED
jgi:hypothetical protein